MGAAHRRWSAGLDRALAGLTLEEQNRHLHSLVGQLLWTPELSRTPLPGVRLSPREARVLYRLDAERGATMPVSVLVAAATAGGDAPIARGTLRVIIHTLRAALKPSGCRIESEFGNGYRLALPEGVTLSWGHDETGSRGHSRNAAHPPAASPGARRQGLPAPGALHGDRASHCRRDRAPLKASCTMSDRDHALRILGRHFATAERGVGLRPAELLKVGRLPSSALYELQDLGWAVLRNGQLWITDLGRQRLARLSGTGGADARSAEHDHG